MQNIVPKSPVFLRLKFRWIALCLLFIIFGTSVEGHSKNPAKLLANIAASDDDYDPYCIEQRTRAYLRRDLARTTKKREREEKEKVYEFLKENPVQVFPYDFVKTYDRDNIQVYTDDSCDMLYVLHESKRLYFPSEYCEHTVRHIYVSLLIEQDINSPHRYEYGNFRVKEGDVVVDVGSAEGNFALSVVERAKKIYLFEPEEEWTPALEKTFEPWRDKVVIVRKYVSDTTTETEVRLDDYFEGMNIHFLKIDVEGAELQVLQGGEKLLANQRKLQVVVCAYHKPHDEDIINDWLQARRFRTHFSNGYMIFEAPWLRRGLIRATKR